MNQEVKDPWVRALRSGEYAQGNGALRKRDQGEDRYCCLGVLCEIAVSQGVIDPPFDERETGENSSFIYGGGMGEIYFPPAEVQNWAGLSESDPIVSKDVVDKLSNDQIERVAQIFKIIGPGSGRLTLSSLNDTARWSFEDIADIVEGL